MGISEKIKTIDNKIEQNKAQYNFARQTAKISALSSGNVSKYKFLSSKDVLSEKDLLEKAATIKRLEYSPLGKELSAQADMAKKQYQKLDDTYEFDNIIKKEKPVLENYSKSDLIYNSSYCFYKYYRESKKFDNLSLESKYLFLAEFFIDLNKSNKLNPKNKAQKRKKMNVYDNASDLYNNFLAIYFNEYNEILDAKRNKMKHKYEPKKLFLETYNYDVWFENQESSDTKRKSDKEESVDLSYMPSLEGDEEVKEGKGLKNLTPNKLLTRLPILLAQIKAGNNSYNLKNEIREILYLLCKHNKITKKFYNNLIKSLH